MRVLGIETSCDDTGIAIYDDILGLLSNQLFSQFKIHAQYGGVIPEIASREHVNKIVLLIQKALKESKLSIKDIDAIAYTAGPGMVGSLFVGAAMGTALSFSLNCPIILVNHMEAHLLSCMLETNNHPSFPLIALLISGGHTELIKACEIGKYQLLGKSRDDAVGEAFDKVANLLNLKYPNGKTLSKLAEKGNIGRFKFPRPMIHQSNLDFSFSGIKTFAANIIKQSDNDFQTKADIAKEFEEAIFDSIVFKCKQALKRTRCKNLVVAGGVSSNSVLRNKLNSMISYDHNIKIFYPLLQFCNDNAAMIAYTGFVRFNNRINSKLEITIYPKWPITDLQTI